MRKVNMPEENTNQVTAPGIPPVDNTVLPENNTPMSNPPVDNASSNNAQVGMTPVNDASVGANGVATPSEPADNVVVDPATSPEDVKASFATDTTITTEVATKIADSKNVLIALSSDPSVDEMAAAIGLSLFLDKLGKRATAIYSGTTPNALEFLKPEQTFEPTADTLQDFVIAINKDKADHLRYKLDGDFVKIYITPYKTKISEGDLDFSYGDYNVDLVLALDVANGIDLDSALREHGRIMHDAVIVNITTGNPGKFGEIEWSDKKASSVSEMIAKLLYSTSSSDKIGKTEATAFLTGIVAATNRFSNSVTTPETLQVASKLMDSGANQQLVSKNITPDIENEMFSLNSAAPTPEEDKNPADLNIEHQPGDVIPEVKNDEKDDTDNTEKTEETAENTEKSIEEKPVEEKPSEEKSEESESGDTMLDDLKAAEESLSHAGAETTPEAEQASVKIDSENNTSNMDEVSSNAGMQAGTIVETSNNAASDASPSVEQRAVEAPAQEKVLTPSNDFDSTPMTLENESKYGKMLEDALDSVGANNVPAPTAIADAGVDGNPAAMSAPAVASNPEINGVPEMNYMPPSDEQILPPPPAPPVDMSNMMPSGGPSADFGTTLPTNEPVVSAEPAAPVAEPTPEPLGDQPAMQDQVYGPQAADPGAFKIPGM